MKLLALPIVAVLVATTLIAIALTLLCTPFIFAWCCWRRWRGGETHD